MEEEGKGGGRGKEEEKRRGASGGRGKREEGEERWERGKGGVGEIKVFTYQTSKNFIIISCAISTNHISNELALVYSKQTRNTSSHSHYRIRKLQCVAGVTNRTCCTANKLFILKSMNPPPCLSRQPLSHFSGG